MPHSDSNLEINGKIVCVGITLEANEHLHLVIRKHWIILAHTLALLLLLIGLCVGVYTVGELGRVPSVFVLTTMFGMVMIGIQYIFVHWVNDELDILILTNRRIIALEQIKFLDRKLSQASIDQVQEVNAATTGFLGNVLHYGSLTIQTAGDASDFHLDKISESLEKSHIIHGYIDEYRQKIEKK